VTIQYHEGQPLGMLLGALRPMGAAQASFARPIPIGLDGTITPDCDSVLYARVNDSGAQLADNAGDLVISAMPGH
jgi:hypothetical protein